MDPKKKRIYIVIITVCILGSLGVWLWGTGSSPSVPNTGLIIPDPTTPQATTSNTANATLKPSADGTYPAPAVFPANNKLDTSIFDQGSSFQIFKSYTATSITPAELNRDDPFKAY